MLPGKTPKLTTIRLVNMMHRENTCWVWDGAVTKDGYGKTFIMIGKYQKNILAHRLSYQVFVGDIPEGLTLDHLCRVKSCINPDHLQPVTMAENLLRAKTIPTTINANKTHCKNGHPFDDENTIHYINKKNGRPARGCKICHKFSNRKHALIRRERLRNVNAI